MSESTDNSGEVIRYRVTGMDCAADAAEIENAVRSVGVRNVNVSTATQVLVVETNQVHLPDVERAVAAIGYQLDRLSSAGVEVELTASHIAPAYRRALWIVVLLNVGYGVIEAAGGLMSDSQALKADALDFLGDGVITFLGLLAIRWRTVWRARAALIQGLFLAALSLGVLISTGYRVVVLNQPEAQLMGLFGIIALVVNVAAALVLVPHRTGDANMRAVWLFSRNDAIGNASVVVAALLVSLTKTAWPDLVVAGVIAGLFLHSAWAIVRDARVDLRTL